jgi:hypothetical protein
MPPPLGYAVEPRAGQQGADHDQSVDGDQGGFDLEGLSFHDAPPRLSR